MPVLKEMVDEWVIDIGYMARSRKFPAIRRFGEGLVAIWEQQHILFGDIHENNVGFRDGEIVIIDPGHIAVIDPSALS
jgi:Ser/Thr protein kinase RdoA (MazF antagonist)